MPRPIAEPRAPRFSPITFGDLTPGGPGGLAVGADLDGVHFPTMTPDEVDLDGARLIECRIDGLRTAEADLRSTRFGDVQLDGLDTPILRAPRTQWRDVRITGRVGSLEAYEANWRSVHFAGCKLTFVNLRSATLLDVAFTDCVIEELDLAEAKLTRVGFDNTRIGTLETHRTTNTDVDLRGAHLSTVGGLTGLRGMTVTSTQVQLLAPLFAAELGIGVCD